MERCTRSHRVEPLKGVATATMPRSIPRERGSIIMALPISPPFEWATTTASSTPSASSAVSPFSTDARIPATFQPSAGRRCTGCPFAASHTASGRR